MTDSDLTKLAQAIALCQSRDNYKVAFFCSHQSTVRYLLEHAKLYFNVMSTKATTGEIGFENGSKIFLSVPQSVTGYEVHEVFFDELDNIEYELKQHLRTRARLK